MPFICGKLKSKAHGQICLVITNYKQEGMLPFIEQGEYQTQTENHVHNHSLYYDWNVTRITIP